MHNYSEEEKKEITERIEKARKFLEENHLNLSAQIYFENIGNDAFATKVLPYLQDTKYDKSTSKTEESLGTK